MNFNFDEPSCLEPDQIPQSVRQSQMSVPDESQLLPPQSQSQSRKKLWVDIVNRELPFFSTCLGHK